jgi:hypothetical protein
MTFTVELDGILEEDKSAAVIAKHVHANPVLHAVYIIYSLCYIYLSNDSAYYPARSFHEA